MKNILSTIGTVVSNKAARQILFTKHHSPKILFVAGTVGFVGTVVLAVRATMKLDEILESHEKQYNDLVHNTADGFFDESGAEVSASVKEYRRLQIRTGLEIAKVFALPIGLGAASIAALTGSHIILSRRNGALVAAYVGLDRWIKEYRQRITNEYGEDTERKFAIGKEIEIEGKTADGKVKKTTALAIHGDHAKSPYTEVFDERSRFFSKEPGMNPNILMMKQNYANDKLRAQGHLYLMEVLDLLGLPRTAASTQVGWVHYSDHDRQKRIDAGLPVGDNRVDFGVFFGEPEWVNAFVDGDEKYAVLDFNVDGMIAHILYGKNS